jgi:hypothetical protein
MFKERELAYKNKKNMKKENIGSEIQIEHKWN